MGQRPTYGSELHLWVAAPLVGQSVGPAMFSCGPTSTCGAALWGRGPLVGRSPTYGSEVQGFTYGSQLHLWVAAPLVGQSVGPSAFSFMGPHPLVGQRYGAEPHLWGRAPLMGQSPSCGLQPHLWGRAQHMSQSVWVTAALVGHSSTYGSVRGSSHVHPWAHIHLWGSAMGQSFTCGSELHL